MTEKPEEEVAEGHLGDLTDEDWRTAHEALKSLGVIPESELEYIWAPGEEVGDGSKLS